MAELIAIQNYLNSFGRQVTKEAKGNIKDTALASSVKFRVTPTTTGFQIDFKMAKYGQFVDKGVSGNKKIQKYTDWKGVSKPSPFQYKTKQPPADILAKWISKKGIKGRDKKSGRYITNLSLAFIFARSIKRDGLKSLSFFQKPLGDAMEEFGIEMLAAVKEDIIKGFTKIKQT